MTTRNAHTFVAPGELGLFDCLTVPVCTKGVAEVLSALLTDGTEVVM
jgi:hypothetical protein